MLLYSRTPDVIFLMFHCLEHLLLWLYTCFWILKCLNPHWFMNTQDSAQHRLPVGIKARPLGFACYWYAKFLPGAVSAGPQGRSCTPTDRCCYSDQWRPRKEATAGLQDGDHRWRGGSHSYSGNQEEAVVTTVMRRVSYICVKRHRHR